jgi:hypothetical protein
MRIKDLTLSEESLQQKNLHLPIEIAIN